MSSRKTHAPMQDAEAVRGFQDYACIDVHAAAAISRRSAAAAPPMRRRNNQLSKSNCRGSKLEGGTDAP
jgi:hypothetical protein